MLATYSPEFLFFVTSNSMRRKKGCENNKYHIKEKMKNFVKMDVMRMRMSFLKNYSGREREEKDCVV